MWNYRVFKGENGEHGIVEVYYNDNGVPTSRTAGFVMPYGEDYKELKRDIEHMVKAFEKPVLTDGDFKYEDESL